jgi:hypothetical protein
VTVFLYVKNILRTVIFASLLLIISMSVYACTCMGPANLCECGKSVIHLNILAVTELIVFFIVLAASVFYAVRFVGGWLRNRKSRK